MGYFEICVSHIVTDGDGARAAQAIVGLAGIVAVGVALQLCYSSRLLLVSVVVVEQFAAVMALLSWHDDCVLLLVLLLMLLPLQGPSLSTHEHCLAWAR
eukprot:3347010-Pyramimonas_sp.AAC.1